VNVTIALSDEDVERIAQRVVALSTNSAPADPWLSIGEAAEHLRASRQRLYDLCAAGLLKPAKDGRRLLFRRSWLDAYLSGERPTDSSTA